MRIRSYVFSDHFNMCMGTISLLCEIHSRSIVGIVVEPHETYYRFSGTIHLSVCQVESTTASTAELFFPLKFDRSKQDPSPAKNSAIYRCFFIEKLNFQFAFGIFIFRLNKSSVDSARRTLRMCELFQLCT